VTTQTAADVKDRQTKHWNNVAGGWATWLGWTERNFSPLTEWFVETAGWAPDASVVDVACGAGYPALAAAARVRPGGRVLACDISPAMTAAAARAAEALGVKNIEFRTMDAEALALDDRSVDAVTNAYGLMFCPNPQQALHEAYRVLRPGGRVTLATWDEAAKSPFFAVMTAVAATHLSLAPQNPSAPGPFRLSSSEELESMLQASGFSSVHVESLPMTFECESVAQYCQIFGDVAWKGQMAALSDTALARFQDAVGGAAQPHLRSGRLRLAATSLCASGQKR
jgi:ubiquinone/menaquinone biosynthesis C-methylase UbiE